MNYLHLCLVIGAGLCSQVLANSSDHNVRGQSSGPECSRPLGMQDGLISDAQLSASSSYEINSVGPYQARLNNNRGGGAWCPKSFISEATGTDEFLEIDLGEDHRISGVVTQGRFANGLGQEYAELFLVQYWRRGMPDFEGYADASGVDLFTGNSDTYTEVETLLNPPVVASRVRIIPFSRHPRTVCMRVELLGCKTNSIDASAAAPKPTLQPPVRGYPSPPVTASHNDDTEKYQLVQDNNNNDMVQKKKMRETTMLEVDLNPADVADHEVVVLEPWWETEYMGVAVGVLVTVILVLIVIIVFILYKNYKTGGYPDGMSASGSHYYETRVPKFDHPEAQWPSECRKLTVTRKLPPTPTTSEEHYTDSSAEYSSPLLTAAQKSACNGGSGGRQYSAYMTAVSAGTKHMHPDWETFFPSPPPTNTPPRLTVPRTTAANGYMKPVSHYAATDVITSSSGSGGLVTGGGSAGKIYGKGTTYFL